MSFMSFWLCLCLLLVVVYFVVLWLSLPDETLEQPATALGGEMIGPSIQERDARQADD